MQLYELPRQRQAKPGALHLLGRRSHLPELLEDRLLVLRRDADAGVADRDLDGPVHGPAPDVDPAAIRGELDGVRQQVQEHLLDLPLIAPDLAQSLIRRLVKGNASAAGPFPHQGEGVVDRGGKIEVGQLQLHPSGLDLREVEDVVDQGEQVLPRGVDVFQVLFLLLVEVTKQPFAQDLGEANDGVQRRPQLVRHVG